MRTIPLDRLVTAEAAARLLAFRAEVTRALPGAVREVVLFGSRARGDAAPESDYDVAVLLAGDLAQDRGVRGILSDAAFEHGIQGFDIAPVALPADTFAQGRVPATELAQRIAAEGVPVR